MMDIALPVLVFFLGLWIVGRLPSLQEGGPSQDHEPEYCSIVEKLVQT